MVNTNAFCKSKNIPQQYFPLSLKSLIVSVCLQQIVCRLAQLKSRQKLTASLLMFITNSQMAGVIGQSHELLGPILKLLSIYLLRGVPKIFGPTFFC